ncbi:2-oxo-4-hydroxy-4-carboxy-5-ureidoimidazoline decarboxylase [Salipaludibacillus agaradhaerens]|uniref:2-oxo-4-hydroxy-4-carboxy-5-ureidoimidazoline decarboxylase n=1 Tax=Salipaludibacillus agaradhaerens TaxID=76935 RepID=UPI000998A4C9|nr:2-oxo-4-hydroxy-4-carboxy-5-ureidoimidazoline decarboxylase [Salipaludibacillus agaradhaerens]MCR6105504.1 2-oxo-4-hydroxy-4-carboxy-5-ureidoimidazoline decarboxylase [Salipaludibacillus agaradhaerens]MCR6117542.1 2-oxo-4-hydroxy-4-carboxy-5-ureidoimidazoline decarboxylase [Salipaludibacillus agaradhaerens]
MYTITEVNSMQASEFITTIGPVFEHSPWVAEKTWPHRPFTCVTQLHNRMTKEMYQANTALKLSLLRAHPDLGTKLTISETSGKEQREAGLNRLTEKEYNQFADLNDAYVKQFGFPFIVAVKGKKKEQILHKMKKRRHHSYEKEMETALEEVSKIAGFRLNELIHKENDV